MAAKSSPRESILSFFTPKRKRSDTSSTCSLRDTVEWKRLKDSSPITIIEDTMTNMEEEDLAALISKEVNKRLESVFDELKEKAKSAVTEALKSIQDIHAHVSTLEEENAALKQWVS